MLHAVRDLRIHLKDFPDNMKKKTETFLIENKWLIITGVILSTLSLFRGSYFLIIILLYILFIKIFLSDVISAKIRKYTVNLFWVIGISLSVATIYVNYHLPHGPTYPTGEIVCQNDDRGPCREEYEEDMRNVDIPDSAKFIRENFGITLIALVFAGIVLDAQNKKQS